MRTAYVVGIAGGSGAGKTTLADAVAGAVGADRVARLPLDAYYQDQSGLPPDERATVNFDSPDALDLDRFVRDLETLRVGGSVRVPTYDFRTHTRGVATIETGPAPVVLAEGVLLGCTERILRLVELLVFVDAPEAVCRARRLARDVLDRGRTAASVLAQWSRCVRPMHDAWVEPVRARAPVVVSGEAPVTQAAEEIAARIRSHTDLTDGPPAGA